MLIHSRLCPFQLLTLSADLELTCLWGSTKFVEELNICWWRWKPMGMPQNAMISILNNQPITNNWTYKTYLHHENSWVRNTLHTEHHPGQHKQARRMAIPLLMRSHDPHMIQLVLSLAEVHVGSLVAHTCQRTLFVSCETSPWALNWSLTDREMPNTCGGNITEHVHTLRHIRYMVIAP